MTIAEIEENMAEVDAAWHGPTGTPMMHSNMPTVVANYRASLEVAYQLAVLNEQICGVLNSRIPQIRVMVESGEYPLQVRSA